MRITGGRRKGMRLRAPADHQTRPTTDVARKAIFDILAGQVEHARVLDLFAGSGALGIEALSRGALEAVFIDSSREACSTIVENLAATGDRGRGIVQRADALRFLANRSRPRPEIAFDVAFLDPPYDRGLGFVARILGKLGAGGWIRPGGAVVVSSATGPVSWPSGFRQTRVRPFGRTQIAVAVRDDDA